MTVMNIRIASHMKEFNRLEMSIDIKIRERSRAYRRPVWEDGKFAYLSDRV